MLAFVQAKYSANTSSVASQGATFSSNTTNANFILVCVFSSDGSDTNVSSISDSQTNTYTRIMGSANQGLGMEMWYAKNITGGTTPTVTVNFSVNARPIVVVREYSGVHLTVPIDVFNSGRASDSTTPGSNAINTNFADEIIVGFASAQVDPDTWSLGSGYGNLTTSASGNISGTVGVEDKIVSSTGNYSADFIISSSGSWEAAVVGLAGAIQAATTSTSSSTSSTSSSTSTTASGTTSTSSTSISLSTSTSTTTMLGLSSEFTIIKIAEREPASSIDNSPPVSRINILH